jgi:hypothetical protein
LQAVPPADRHTVVAAAHHAFVTGFNTIALVSVAVAAVGCVAGYALVVWACDEPVERHQRMDEDVAHHHRRNSYRQ